VKGFMYPALTHGFVLWKRENCPTPVNYQRQPNSKRIQNPSQFFYGWGGILRVHKHSSQNQISSSEYIYIFGCGSQFFESSQITTQRTTGGSFNHPDVLWGDWK
jgi:hypothetical protein